MLEHAHHPPPSSRHGCTQFILNQITPHWQHVCKLDVPQLNLLVEVLPSDLRSVLWLWANRIALSVLAGGCIMVPPAQIKWYSCPTT